MRATKAYITSLGTTGLLLAFAASLLLLVGTLLAFDGWPGADIRDSVESVLVDDDDDPTRVAGPEQIALDAASAAVAVAPGPTGAGAPAFGGGSAPSGTVDGDGTVGAGTPEGGFGGGGGGGTTPTTGVPSAPTEPSIDSSRGSNQLADNTEQLTNNLGETVGQVSPQLGNTVTETGQALSDIVRDLPDVKVDGTGVTIGD